MKTISYFTTILFLSICLSCSEDSDMSPKSDTGKGGSLARFTIVDSTMYLVDNREIKVFDIKNEKDPALVQSVNISANDIETIFHFGDYLYLGSSTGMYIYDIQDPRHPNYMSMATHASGCDPVVSDGEFAYVTVKNTLACNRFRNLNILEIYDVQDPGTPKLLSTTSMEAPSGLAIDDDILFVCDNGLKVFDVSERRAPLLLKVIPSDAFDIIINGNVILTVDPKGINQYLYDRENLELTHTSQIKTVL